MVAAIEPPKMMIIGMFADEHVQVAAHEHHRRSNGETSHKATGVMISMKKLRRVRDHRPF